MRETRQNHSRLWFREGRNLGRWTRRLVIGAMTALTVSFAGLSASHAEDLKALGDFGDWSAYVITEGGKKTCFMASQPVKAEGDYTQRGDIHMLVTHRPAQNASNEVSVVTGYPYKGGSEASLAIGRKTWRLFTKGERAWAYNGDDDKAITEALRKGSSMVVKGSSSRGTLTTDTYSLRGSSAAYEAISNACGVPVS